MVAEEKKTRHSSYDRLACPVEATLELIGGKWKGMLLFYLLQGPMRFSELEREIGCISQRMLAKQLRELEAVGLVGRTVFPEVPPRVEYQLSEEGRSLEPILLGLKEWGETRAVRLLEQRGSV